MKKCILILTVWLTLGSAWGQIPRMLQEPWYRILKANQTNVDEVSGEEGQASSAYDLPVDVINEMREAYNNREWQRVDSLFDIAQRQAPDNLNIYNWERNSLRRQVQDTENASETMNRLMGLYATRKNAGLPIDMPYRYGTANQWNEAQRMVDYATYAGRRIDAATQFDYLMENLSALEKPLNVIVLCRIIDLTLTNERLSDEEFLALYSELTEESHTTRDWLNDNFLSMETKTASDMLQALAQREAVMKRDVRVQTSIHLAQEAAEEERLKNSNNMDERSQYYLRVATRHLANKEYNEAVSALQTSIDLNKDNPVAYLRLAECYTSNSQVTGRVGNFLDKYYNQFAAVAAIDMLRENMHYVQSQQGRSALTTQIDQLRTYLNRNPLYRQDLFRLSLGFGDTMRLGSYIKRTITLKERY